MSRQIVVVLGGGDAPVVPPSGPALYPSASTYPSTDTYPSP